MDDILKIPFGNGCSFIGVHGGCLGPLPAISWYRPPQVTLWSTPFPKGTPTIKQLNNQQLNNNEKTIYTIPNYPRYVGHVALVQ